MSILKFTVGGILLFLPCFSMVYGQELPVFNQYFFNEFLINPAAAGSDGYTTICLTADEQMTGIKGAPKTHSINFQTRLYNNSFIRRDVPVRRKYKHAQRRGRVGLGANILYDWNGIFERTSGKFSYAYHITVRASQFSFGLALKLSYLGINEKRMVLSETSSYLEDKDINVLISPDYTAGIYYSSKQLNVGISVDNLMQSAISYTSYPSSHNFKRVVNITAGYRSQLNSNFMIEPSFYFRTANFDSYQFDVGLRTFYKDDFWFGASYKTGNIISYLGGVKINRIYIGYLYNNCGSALSKYTYGNYELMIALKLGDNSRRYRWLRRY